ncbi:imidazole glycerol phosphate synthase subunit HisH [Pacificimonas sp. WHA3]|uniref:Imidazole glycerol phosphate synthase subunit HisH n=1 Tax=Pacificimonas pallii TaxID=2827236 RepID=A0ABS6SC74_9SPHN|nr:imidazole glycerol phosphate synthase subunit HisH [Pacificimonas pallii]MBV7255825.1 imidazole glycerol phosphate synthase subunit HisH [Pacificimonas pallii]
MAQRIAVIDYGAGNLRSVAKAVETAAKDCVAGGQVVITDSAKAVSGADRIVLPGVGAFGQCATALRSVPGMIEMLEERVVGGGAPFLGICVGMQLMAGRSRERGTHQGLGWIKGEVVKLDPVDPGLKVPHMGWSQVSMKLAGMRHDAIGRLEDNGEAYFVHSYHFDVDDHACLLATSDYGESITSIIGRDNLLGTQFHPEKSQHYGLAFLRAFLDWKP